MATRLTLRTNARARADQDLSNFPTDAQYNVFLDRAASAVWRRLVASGWLPDRKTVTIAANGATAYNVATDVFEVISVMRVESSVRTDLKRVKPEALATIMTGSGTGPAAYYQLLGGATATLQLELFPVPTSGTYEVRYINRFPGFAADGDFWYGPDGTDELIEVGAAIRGVKKEDGDIRGLTAEFEELWQQVLAGAHWLDKDNPTVRDTRQAEFMPFDFQAVDGNIL